MRLIIAYLLLFSLFQSAYAQNKKPWPALAAVKQNGKWGYIDTNGNFIIPPKYDKALPFSEGVAAVNIGFSDSANHLNTGKWGYINPQGEWVIQPQFENANPFSDGLAMVSIGGEIASWGLPVYVQGKTGYIGHDGKWVLGAQAYRNQRDFHEGMAAIGHVGKAAWGYMNKKGVMVITPAYDDVSDFNSGRGVIGWDLNTHAMVNSGGKRLFQVTAKMSPFSEGIASVQTDSDISLVDTAGQTLVTLKNIWIMGPFHEGLAYATTWTNKPMTGFMDKRGKWVIPASYLWAGNFSDGLALVLTKPGKADPKAANYYVYIDHTGKPHIDTRTLGGTDFQPCMEGMCRYRKGKQWSFINKNGKSINAWFEDALDFSQVDTGD